MLVAEKLLGVKESDIIGKYAPDVALRNDLMRTFSRKIRQTGTENIC